MGQKDITEKILEAYNDVFADIVNVLLFDGETVIREDELEDQTPRSVYKADGKYHEVERDVAKRWKNGDIRVACVGLENQSKADALMPLRVLAYDGGEYRAQLNNDKLDHPYPVVTLVLYFGIEKHWDKPLNLCEVLTIPEKFKPFVSDYHINVFEIAWLPHEKVAKFKSDFGIVADYFVQMRETGEYKASPENLRHVKETLDLLSVMADDFRFEGTIDLENGNKGTVHNMSEFLTKIEEKGRIDGFNKGQLDGFNKGQLDGLTKGENRSFALMQCLLSAGRTNDLQRAAADTQYREELMKEFSLA